MPSLRHMKKSAVLFLCTDNSALSQMAEALFRKHSAGRFDTVSAGTAPGTVHPLAIEAMAEIGLDISQHRAKHVDEIMGRVPVRYLFVLLEKPAKQHLEVFPSRLRTIHWPIPDPSAESGAEGQRIEAFRHARNLIEGNIIKWLGKHAQA